MRLALPITLCLVLLLSACDKDSATTSTEPVVKEINSANTVDKSQNPLAILNKITDGVWLHTSSQDIPGYGVVPSNGLAIKDQDSLILVNTAWGELATVELAERLKKETGLEISKLVVIHFHPDSLAGVDWLEAQGVKVMSHPMTPNLSAQRGTPIPNTSVPALLEAGSRVKLGPIEISYPGPAHTEDNLMVYVSGPKILFGGCAVRAAKHTSLGNIADANLEKWPDSLRWAKATYPDTKMTVPSHGNPVAGLSLIDHSLSLLETSKKP